MTIGRIAFGVRILGTVLALTGCSATALAQQTAQPPALSVERFAALPALAALPAASLQPSALTEFIVNWNVASDQNANAAVVAPLDAFQILNGRPALGPLPLERAPQFSEDRLVVIAVNAQGTEIGWQMVPDPSLVRAEFPDANGNLTGQILRRPQASFLVTLPDTGPPINQLRVYRPRWTGSAFVLDPLGTAAVPDPLLR